MGGNDERGVSEVLGAMLLFGIVVLALGGYQSFIVPAQNAEVEHNHDQQINSDFPEIQTALSNAVASGSHRTTSLTLGTEYPSRAISMNPPTVSGTLRTATGGEISLTDADSNLSDICGLPAETRAIHYRANYNELRGTGEFVYENGVTYRRVDDSVIPKTDQELVDGSTIRLYPLTNGSFSTSRESSTQLRFHPGETGRTAVESNSSIAISFPSQLSGGTWSERLLDGEASVTGVSKSDGVVTVELAPGSYTVECTPVGIGTTPEQGTVPDVDEDAANRINPSGDGEVVLTSTSGPANGNSNSNVSIFLEDRTESDETLEIAAARLNFYSATSPGRSPSGESYLTLGGTGFEPGGAYKDLDEPIALDGDPTEVELDFEEGVEGDDFYVLTLGFDNGDVNTYFVSHQSKNSDGG